MASSSELYEFLLNGILHLFAILSSVRGGSSEGTRRLVENYLRGNLGIANPDDYIGLFDDLLDFCLEMEDVSELENRLAHLCRQLNSRLTPEQKHILFLRIFELSKGAGGTDSRLDGLIRRTMDMLSVDENELIDLRALVLGAGSPEMLSERFVLLRALPPTEPLRSTVLVRNHFQAECTFLKTASTGRVFMVARSGDVTLDGAIVPSDTVCVIEPGSILRDINSNTIYYFEIDRALRSDHEQAPAICFEARDVNYRFPGTEAGLHNFNFKETSGRLIGVMGGSGVGKSTLINILNGSLPPDSGSITVNDIDLHTGREQLQGVIGYVPQDDLLLEDLTVYQNLYFNARLCMAHLNEDQIRKRIEAMLEELNQSEISHLKVGGPLDKTISGGQRKRLNIALELMREPSILFVDEPTSGLSSADSENVMGLLKAQAERDKLVVAIIHQPSSSIFRMLDSLWILDKGGYPIYMGHPLEAAPHFRNAAHMAGTDRSACPECGNVHPEQIFGIIEARVIDEEGRFTHERKHPPGFWHELYLRKASSKAEPDRPDPPPPEEPARSGLERPSLPGQIMLFFRRNLMSRLANRPYMVVTLLEPPLLGWITATLCRTSVNGKYTFGDNPYLGIFFFMSTVIALFIGLSVSAEEIVKDRRILKRESFLHLSWFSYTTAKMLYIVCVSAVQMALCALVCVPVLKIPDFTWKLWAILFSCSVFGGALGLNISASLKTAVAVYILIPLLLIPQMLLGGLIIKFDDLRSPNAGNNLVPIVGELMTARWGFEALVVEQFESNRYERLFYDSERDISRAGYMAQYLIPEIISRIDSLYLKADIPDKAAKDALTRRLIGHEIKKLELMSGGTPNLYLKASSLGPPDRKPMEEMKTRLRELIRSYDSDRLRAQDERRAVAEKLLKEYGENKVLSFQKKYLNKSILELARNKNDLEKVRISGERLIQVSDPVYQRPSSPWGRAPFMAGTKRLGSLTVTTYTFNMLVIWAMAFLLCLALYARLLPRLVEGRWWQALRPIPGALRPACRRMGTPDPNL